MNNRERRAQCVCMCHEGGPATEHGVGQKCPCKEKKNPQKVEWSTEVTVSVYESGEAYIMFPAVDKSDTVRTVSVTVNVDLDTETGLMTGIEFLDWPLA